MDIFGANSIAVNGPATPVSITGGTGGTGALVGSGSGSGSGSGNGKLRVMLCGTHYLQYNGYSRVVYELMRRMDDKEDLEMTLYGFQHSHETAQVNRKRLGPRITVVDAFGLENPKRNGFGEQEIAAYLQEHPQDIVIIYNDMSVTTMLVENILKKIGKPCRLVSYIDQVYLHQKPRYISLLNQVFDHTIAFTEYWRDLVIDQGLRKDMKVDVLQHGFNHEMYYPIPRRIACAYFGMDPDTFYVLNLNRNQPRKRWDICIKTWVDIIHRHMEREKKKKTGRKIKLVIGTAIQGAWDLMEIFMREIQKRKLGDAQKIAQDYLLILDRPQQMTDTEINLLYSACDIGINTCDGEGFGLCNFEHAAIGRAQVIPLLGGFRDFFHENNAKTVIPKFNLYVDNARDLIGGETELSDPKDFATAIWEYYLNPQVANKHGEQARAEILQHYEWDVIAEHFYKVIKSIGSVPIRPLPETVKL